MYNTVKKKLQPGMYSYLIHPGHSICYIRASRTAPHFDYCNIIWGTCNQMSFHNVHKLQNRAARIPTGAGRYESATAALNTLKWHNLRESHDNHLVSKMY